MPVNSRLKGTIPVAQGGTYILRVKMKDANQFTLEIENPLFVVRADSSSRRENWFRPFASASNAKRPKEFHSQGIPGFVSRYFYVPGDANYFKVYISGSGQEWVSFKIITPDGEVYLSEEEMLGGKEFTITVPASALAQVWQLAYRNLEDATFRLSAEGPGWLAAQPNRLIVPEEYVKQ